MPSQLVNFPTEKTRLYDLDAGDRQPLPTLDERTENQPARFAALETPNEANDPQQRAVLTLTQGTTATEPPTMGQSQTVHD
jgi:hypothetical protein